MYKFAIIGCGRIAHRHAENIKRVGALQAVCDTDKKKADEFAVQYETKAYYNIDDLLKAEKEIDIVCVCTPNGYHAEHSIKSLQAGKHVLCEKPMCLTSAAAWQMADTAHFFRKKLFVVKQNRYNPPIQFLKNLLDQNKLGVIYSFQINCFWNRPQQYYTGDWKGSKNLDGGLLYTQFSHFIDLLYWLLGDVNNVTGIRKKFNQYAHLHFEDTGICIVEMKTGVIGSINYTINSYNKNSEGSFTLFAENGSIKIGGQYLNTVEWQNIKDVQNFREAQTSQANDYGFYTGSMSNHDKVYNDLIKALDNHQNILPSVLESIKTVEIIEMIYNGSNLKNG